MFKQFCNKYTYNFVRLILLYSDYSVLTLYKCICSFVLPFQTFACMDVVILVCFLGYKTDSQLDEKQNFLYAKEIIYTVLGHLKGFYSYSKLSNYCKSIYSETLKRRQFGRLDQKTVNNNTQQNNLLYYSFILITYDLKTANHVILE